MEEVATCECGSQRWTIFCGRIECESCGKEYTFITKNSDMTIGEEPIKAQEIDSLVNVTFYTVGD